MKSKNKITLLNMGSTIILQGLAFLSGPIFSSVLGTNNYGIAAVYLTWAQIVSTVFSLQAGGAVAVARVNYSEDVQEKYQSSAISLATIAYIGFSVVTLCFCSVYSGTIEFNIPMIVLGLIHGWGLYCVSFMNQKLTYEFKAGWNLILSVLTSVLTIGASIFLIYVFKPEENYWGRIIGQSAVYALIGIVLVVYMLRRGKEIYNKEYWKFTLPITIPTIFHSLAHIVLNQSDKVMIQGMVSNSAAGIYALASSFSAVMNAFWHAFNNSWVPFYYEYTSQGQIDKMKKHARNYIELFTIVAMGFILLSREVFHLYAANQDFWAGTDLIPLFAIGYYFVFLYSFPVNYEFYNKRTKTIAIGTIAAAVLNIILNYVMITLWGIIGAVIATAIAHGLQFIFHFISAKKINPGEFPFSASQFIPGFLAVCGTAALYWVTRGLWFVRWGLGAVLGVYILLKIYKRKEIY
ncbi:oligosaccharide flippase family protein [Blautia schinkii]|nr:oligosaccharide flippase family protein [Blautia schinkii]